ncbi:MAG: tetratricopeptide repeat protein [Bacteroidaceae bacterium]|nr:tetratricopeptide repeat protein [Bacteroidaceae bacterium]
MIDFNSPEFQELLSRYEQSRREDAPCYLDSEDYVDLSDYYLDHDKPNEALKVIDEGLSLHPNDDLLPAVRAGVLIYLHRFAEAQEIVEKLDADQNYDVIYLQAQLKYAVDNDLPAADKLFHEWIGCVEDEWQCGPDGTPASFSDDEEDEFTPEEAENEVRSAYMHIMVSYIELSKVDHTEYLRSWIAAYLKRFPQMGMYDPDYNVADICREQGFVDYVETVFERLLDNDPYTPNGWTILAAAQQSSEKYEEALNSLEFALAINPDDVNAIVTKAHCFYAMQNYEEALPLFMKYRRLAKSHSEDQYIAFCYLNLHEAKLAQEYWHTALEYVEKNMDDVAQRAWRYYEISDGMMMCEDYEEALSLIQKSLKIDPKNIDFRLHEASVLLGLHQVEKAIEKFSSLFHDNAAYSLPLMLSAGIRCLSQNYFTLADTFFSIIISKNDERLDFPHRNQVYAYMALAKYQQGYLDETLENLAQACKETPELVKHLFSDSLPDTLQPQDYYAHLAPLVRQQMNDRQPY